jgi:toxic protein SymE
LLQLAIGGIDLSGERESSRILTVYYTYLNQGKDRWPLIRLQGKWLQDLGFLSGAKIEVTESNGGLFIKAQRREAGEDSHAGH